MTEVEAIEREVADYWRTAIIDMAPGRIELRGEQMQQGGRNKGPTPKRFLFTYDPAPAARASGE